MKVGLHYSFQVGLGETTQAVVEGGLSDIEEADSKGFSSVVFAEHHFLDDGWLPRPMMLASAAAAVTSNLRVGTDIVILPLHHPVSVAEEAAVLDVMSGGRAVLGIGLGWMTSEFDGFGVPFEQRATIYQSSIDIIRRLLAGEVVDNDGHYSFRGARVRPLPVNPKGLPIWMGALEDPGVKRAARNGDAWVMPPGTRLDKLRRQLALFSDAREEAMLPPTTEQPLRRETFVAETDEKAWQLFAPGLRHEYGKVYRPLHPTYPDIDTIDNLRRWADGLFVVGSASSVADQLQHYQDELGATECLIRFQLPGVPDGALREAFTGLTETVEVLKNQEAGRGEG